MYPSRWLRQAWAWGERKRRMTNTEIAEQIIQPAMVNRRVYRVTDDHGETMDNHRFSHTVATAITAALDAKDAEIANLEENVKREERAHLGTIADRDRLALVVRKLAAWVDELAKQKTVGEWEQFADDEGLDPDDADYTWAYDAIVREARATLRELGLTLEGLGNYSTLSKS